MKIRNDFVSNSSSSSFVGIGWCLDDRTSFLSIVENCMSKKEYEDILDNMDYLNRYIGSMSEIETTDHYYVCYELGGNADMLIKDISYFKNVTMQHAVMQKMIEEFGEPVLVCGEIY